MCQITIEDLLFARIGPDGNLLKADNNVFKRGEVVNLVLLMFASSNSQMILRVHPMEFSLPQRSLNLETIK